MIFINFGLGLIEEFLVVMTTNSWGLPMCFRNWNRTRLLRCTLAVIFFFIAGRGPSVGQDSGQDAMNQRLQAILAVGPNGAGHAEAMAAVQALSASEEGVLFPVLEAMRGANPIAKNWLRVVAGQAAEVRPLPGGELEKFFADKQNDPDARYLVFRWLTESNDAKRQELLEKSTADPSLPLRYKANRLLMQRAEAKKGSMPQESLELYRTVLNDARNPEQLRTTVDAMKELGETVDLSKHLGMFTTWLAIGPFDNTNGDGFALPQGPEKWLDDSSVAWREAMDKSLQGKGGEVRWKSVSTSDAMGSVDLNPPFDKAKESVVYLYGRFSSPKAGSFEARLGSTNANKVWVNGALVTANEVYHAGAMIDQYVGQCELREGDNWVLLKICQNNQTESWAQDWQFQFRITDTLGTPLGCECLLPESNEASGS